MFKIKNETMNPLVEAINRVSSLTPTAQEKLNRCSSSQILPKNTHLLQTGNISTHFYYIHKGLARVYYHFNELEVTDYFAIDNQFIGGVDSLFTGLPSQKAIQLLEDSEVCSISAIDLERLSAEYHEIERAGRKLATFAFLEVQRRIESIRFHEAKERYMELGKKYPGLLNRCPLKYIASYLGITQVTLSRLRAEI
ncbi:MAG TPA: Crp/Fnr family transcriptional regulator [Sphingobacteriaceae bacterium]